MTTRPIDDGPLPSYMKNIFNKQAGLMQTANSLKMNNYSDGKFSNTASSFWPKKSFNKIIQLNIMNSLKFKEKLGFKDEENSYRYNEIENYIKKSMKFYNKNYDDLLKESMITKFDSITLKTIKKQKHIDYDKYLPSFEQ